MVEVASRTPVPVGIVAWPRYRGAATLIVKATFDLRADGSATLASEQRALSLDVRAPDGSIISPSDFAPHKPLADVVLVGDEARPSSVPGSLSFATIRATGAALGAVPSRPTYDPAWSAPGFDFGVFQVAPSTQRLPQIALPARLAFARGAVQLDVQLDLPSPEVLVVERRGAGWAHEPRRVNLVCDTLLVDPRARVVVAAWRGFSEPPNGWTDATLLIVDPFGALENIGPHDILAWPRARALRPEDVAGAMRAPRETLADEPATVDDTADEPADDMSRTAMQVGGSPARSVTAPTAPMAAVDPASLRRPARTMPMQAKDVERALSTSRPGAAQPSEPPPPPNPRETAYDRTLGPGSAALSPALPFRDAARAAATPFGQPPASRPESQSPSAPRFGPPPAPAALPARMPAKTFDPRGTQGIVGSLAEKPLPFVPGRFEPKPAPMADAADSDAEAMEGEPVGTSTLPFGKPMRSPAFVRGPAPASTPAPPAVPVPTSWPPAPPNARPALPFVADGAPPQPIAAHPSTPPAAPSQRDTALPFAPMPAARESSRGAPSPPSTPAASPPPPAPRVRTGKLTADEIESIQSELDAAPGNRSAILARHGLSELMWRIASPSS